MAKGIPLVKSMNFVFPSSIQHEAVDKPVFLQLHYMDIRYVDCIRRLSVTTHLCRLQSQWAITGHRAEDLKILRNLPWYEFHVEYGTEYDFDTCDSTGINVDKNSIRDFLQIII